VKTLIVIPTYNERENLTSLLPALLGLLNIFDILVVDDGSPDGTQEVVGEWIEKTKGKEKQVFLLPREKKQGLGRAYLAGFDWALSRNYQAVVEMDADFSHRPEDLQKILQALPDEDFVIGSRYVPGGETMNWGWIRKMISRGGSFYSRWILGHPIRDWTGGFNAWKSETLKKMELSSVQSNGYSFQIELKYRALEAGCKGREVPILFEDRRVGQSKMSLKIVLEAFYRVWLIRF
jgi:dolichol-phosphate mannosyltransferase